MFGLADNAGEGGGNGISIKIGLGVERSLGCDCFHYFIPTGRFVYTSC